MSGDGRWMVVRMGAKTRGVGRANGGGVLFKALPTEYATADEVGEWLTEMTGALNTSGERGQLLLRAILAHLEDLLEGFRSGAIGMHDASGGRRSNVNYELAAGLRRVLGDVPREVNPIVALNAWQYPATPETAGGPAREEVEG